MDTPLPQLFISYARPDQEQAQCLKADLERAGHRCWMDMADLKGGRDWLDAIEQAISRCYAFITLASPAANRSKYVRAELLLAEHLGKPVFPVLVEGELPWNLANLQALPLQPDYAVTLKRLLRDLPPPLEHPAASEPPSPRQQELAYLRALRLQDELQKPDLYIHMEGVVQHRQQRIGRSAAHLFMRPEFTHIRQRRERDEEISVEVVEESFEDILEAFPRIHRSVLLGDPGSGKTTTLWKVARDALTQAEHDLEAPLPLLVRLGLWTEPELPLLAFLEQESGVLAGRIDSLFQEGRLLLLLDGLNEIPLEQQKTKVVAIQELLRSQPQLSVILSCRGPDYRDALLLPMDRVVIQPLTPTRILEFLDHYLAAFSGSQNQGRDKAERLFWELAGGAAVRETWEAWQRGGANLDLFWSATEIPRSNPSVWDATSGAQDQIWQERVKSPYNLVRLAENPYMLAMLLEVWLSRGERLPANRGQLFEEFVGILLAREALADIHTLTPTNSGRELLEALGWLAWRLQASTPQGDAERLEQARTSLSLPEAQELLGHTILNQAVGSSLLERGSGIRFTHQLLQEYFTAQGMRERLENGQLDARDFWPEEQWWRRSGWEEAAVLLAGLFHQDCTPVIQWLREAQPEVAADCILRSGARTPDATLEALRERWTHRLEDPQAQEHPAARAAVGRALGRVRLGGRMLDHRPGVGLDADGLPDIEWVEIQRGKFFYQEGEPRSLPTFHIARYPVTNEQFRAFLNASDGHENLEWWRGFESEYREPQEPIWGEGDCPRETVDWYQATAFCRWLSAQRGYEVRLPTEQEWEWAARYIDGREYPWGNGYHSSFANVCETRTDAGSYYLERTSPVGIYPKGRSKEGVNDLAGNVWEWCLNKFQKPEEVEVDTSGDGRVVRGGSWFLNPELARSTFRGRYLPYHRNYNLGFRVLCTAPSALKTESLSSEH